MSLSGERGFMERSYNREHGFNRKNGERGFMKGSYKGHVANKEAKPAKTQLISCIINKALSAQCKGFKISHSYTLVTQSTQANEQNESSKGDVCLNQPIFNYFDVMSSIFTV